MLSKFRNIKHLRLFKWLMYALEWLIFPVGPSLYLIFYYRLYEVVQIGAHSAFTFSFIVILILLGLYVIKGCVSELQLKDAHSDGEYTARFIFTAIYKTVLIIVIVALCIFAAKSLGSLDMSKIENIRNMILSVLYIALFKFIQIWFHQLIIEPLEIVLKERQAAYHLSNIQAQQGFTTKPTNNP